MQLTYAEANRVYRHLSDLKDSLGPPIKPRDRAVVLIGACISNGFDTKHQIIKGLRATGVSTNLVIGILDEQTGTVPGIHLWWCDGDGQYHLFDPVS